MARNVSDAEQKRGSPAPSQVGWEAELPRTGTGVAHGKVILLGEHAAVYGAPTVALPVPGVGCRARVVRSDRAGGGMLSFRLVQTPPGVPCGPMSVSSHAPKSRVPEGLWELTGAMLRQADLRGAPGVDVLVESGVPSARGLGASAACARAVAQALNNLLGLRLNAEAVFHFVQMSENTVHGKASGIDALATGSHRPVLLAGGRISNPTVGTDGWIVVADSGSGASTKEAVTMLRESFTKHPGSRETFLSRSVALTRAGLRDLKRGHLVALGKCLTSCHQLLDGLELTTDRTNHLVEAALNAGALGAKMSGGGLGGCVIALTATERTADALAAVLAREPGVRCWTAPVTKGESHAGI